MWGKHRSLFSRLINLLESDDFKERHRKTSKQFLRSRKLPFKIVILFLINLLQKSLKKELDLFFKCVEDSDVPVEKVTAGAFTQARSKLSYEAFIELDREQTNFFYQEFEYKKWCNFRLVAVDGSTIYLPKSKEIIKEFGFLQEKKTSYSLARISHAFDPLNHITLDAQIAPTSTGELDLIIKHIQQFKVGDLVLLDRAYPCFWLFALLKSKGIEFCAREQLSQSWKQCPLLLKSGDKELISKIYPSPESKKRLKELGLSHITELTIRFLLIELETGEKEILTTSLIDQEQYPHEVFGDLYFNRWPVEESYKKFKHRICIENFTGKTLLAIKQDFFARVFTSNMTAILAFTVEPIVEQNTKERKLEYQMNWSNALSKMKDTCVLLFIRNQIDKYVEILQTFFANCVEAVRPNRRFERNMKYPKRFHMNYKPI